MVKNLPCNAGDLGSISGSGNPPEKGMATHSSILAWRIPDRGARWVTSERAKSQTKLKQLSTYAETKKKEKRSGFHI